MTIVLDAMGSDEFPHPEIEGAIAAAELLDEEIILVGQQERIEPELKALNTKNLPIRVYHAPDMLEMGDKPVESARKKPENSMAVGLSLVKSGEAQAFVTAGNTGAALFNALRTLGRIKGVQRPALTGLFPVYHGHCVVLDIGANADCRPDFLLQFGIMGSIYAQRVLDIPNPRVGLLSNGEEAGKGNQLIKDAYPLLEQSGINFIGNIEGKELFAGEVDVAVTDGFTGNVLLKSSEAVARMVASVLKEELLSSMRTKVGALLAKPALTAIKKLMDPSDVGAAPLLGIDGLVFVGHGRSNAKAITNALRVAHSAVQENLLGALSSAIQDKMSTIEN